MKRIAIYDMDKTITKRPTFTLFLVHVVKRYRPWRMVLMPLAIPLLAAYALRLIDRGTLKAGMQRVFLGKHLTTNDVQNMSSSFAAQTMTSNVRGLALERIAADRAAGYTLVLATASYEFYAGAIANALGFEAIVATKSLRDATSRIAARIDGDNCYGPAKLAMVERWLAGTNTIRSDLHIRFYSDHVSDLPCFEWADEPFAVTPDANLRALATARGWPILDWR